MPAAVSIIVVTHDSAPELRRLTGSLRRHLSPAPQLIVVDNASSDDSVQAARQAGAEVLALEENVGFGQANNLAVARATAPVTALLNPDVELADAGLARLVERAGAEPVLLVPRLVGPDGAIEKSAHPIPGRLGAFAFAALGPALPPPLRVRAEPWRSARPRQVGWAVAAALVARTALLRELGPFDPDPLLFYEDLELCLRARERGVRTRLEPGVVLRHRGGHSTRPAFGGEPHAAIAARRRQVVARRLGRRALVLDDLAQGLTFATRALARRILGRSPARPAAQLAALRAARCAGRRGSAGG